MKITLVIVLIAAAIGALAGGAAGVALDDNHQTATATPVTTVSRTEMSTGLTPEEIYRRAAPAVVVITATQTEVGTSAFGTPTKQKVRDLGSGFVIDTRGDIVTNDHVVQGGSAIRVGFSSGATYPATLVGTDPSTDVAVVRVQASAAALSPLRFASSADVSVGDRVYAIGNPFGLDRTMTAGIVSATGRDIQAPNGLTIANAIQTDAPINHGNSGGPLLDQYGRVVGINSQIEGGTVNANVGIGFAVPSATAESIARQLLATGRVQHAWLGVQGESIDPSLAGMIPQGLPRHGITIARVVAGSPAAKAGLKGATREETVNGVTFLVGGDTIVAVDGKNVGSVQQLGAIIAAKKPGDQLRLQVVHNGRSRSVTVTLGEVPASAS